MPATLAIPVLSRPSPSPADASATEPGFCLLRDHPDADGGPPATVTRLSPGERRRWESMGSAKRRQHFLLGRRAAKDALRQLAGALERTLPEDAALDVQSDHGAPPEPDWIVVDRRTLTPVEVRLSISHTDGHAAAWAVAVADGAYVGVDLERIRRHHDGTARRFCSADEYATATALRDDERERYLVALWAAKEAVFKTLAYAGATTIRELELSPSDPTVPTTELRVSGGARRAAEQLGATGLELHVQEVAPGTVLACARLLAGAR